ncbi:MAG: hypothetical protein MJ245_04240 [Clostridia bacterium]|nr:hypothetical protein [Clostridia bacterium]
MGEMLKRELAKIIDVTNNRKVKFVIKYGIVKAMFTMLVICLLFTLLGSRGASILEYFENLGIKLAISIIPGIFWGIVDYYMYKDITEERKKYRINSLSFILLNGILGWGIICSVSNIDFVPYNNLSLVSALVTLPIYGIILGIVSKKMFNAKLIKQLYQENIKGKNITSVKRKDNVLQMR